MRGSNTEFAEQTIRKAGVRAISPAASPAHWLEYVDWADAILSGFENGPRKLRGPFRLLLFL
jgi:hypothetical protein